MPLTASNLSREKLRKKEMKGRKLNCNISYVLGAVVPNASMEKTSVGLTYHKQLKPSRTSSLNGKAIDKRRVLIKRR